LPSGGRWRRLARTQEPRPLAHAFGMPFDRGLRLAAGLCEGLAGRGLVDRAL